MSTTTTTTTSSSALALVRLFVNQIEPTTTEKDLTELFEPFGTLVYFSFRSGVRTLMLQYQTEKENKKLLLAYKEFIMNPTTSKYKFYNKNSTAPLNIELSHNFIKNERSGYIKLYVADITINSISYSDINSFFEQYGEVIRIAPFIPHKDKEREEKNQFYTFVTVTKTEKTLHLVKTYVKIKDKLIYISSSYGKNEPDLSSSSYSREEIPLRKHSSRSRSRSRESATSTRRRSRSREESSRERRSRRRTRSRSREERRSGRRRSRERRRSRRSRSRSTDSSSDSSSISKSRKENNNNNNTSLITSNRIMIPDLASMENNTISCHDDFLKWKDQFEELKPLYLNRIYFSSTFPPYPVSPSFVSEQRNEATISIPPILPHMTM